MFSLAGIIIILNIFEKMTESWWDKNTKNTAVIQMIASLVFVIVFMNSNETM